MPMKMNNDITELEIGPSKYINEAINNCEKCKQENMPEHKHGCRASDPFQTDYDPDLDRTTEMDEEEATYYPKLVFCIGLSNWGGLILQQKYHFWLHMLHSQERDAYRQQFICIPT